MIIFIGREGGAVEDREIQIPLFSVETAVVARSPSASSRLSEV